jgi:hypothetical protein
MTKERNIEFGAMVALVLLVTKLSTGMNTDGATIAVLLTAILCPQLFTPLSRLWYAAGRRMGSLFSAIVLFPVYFLVVTPAGVLHRLFAGSMLRRRKKDSESVFCIKEKTYCTNDLIHPY